MPKLSKAERKRCKEQVFTGERWDWSGHQCTRYALPGGDYCRIHNPDYRSAVRKHQERLWESEHTVREAAVLVRAYADVIEHQQKLYQKVELTVASGHLIAKTAYEAAREAHAKLAQEKP